MFKAGRGILSMMEGPSSLLFLAILITLHSLLLHETSARQVSIVNNKPLSYHYFAHKQEYECSIEGYLSVTPYISVECEVGLKSLQTASTVDYEEVFRIACDIPNCIAPFLDYGLNLSCYDESFVEYLVLQCGANDLNNGQPCYSQALEDITVFDSFFNDACLSALIDPTTCTEECTNALTKVNIIFGCCINNLLNNTLTRNDATITTYALSYELWTECGVDTPGFCPIDANFTRYLTPQTQEGYVMSFGTQNGDLSAPGLDSLFPDLKPEIPNPSESIPGGIMLPVPQPRDDNKVPDFKPEGGLRAPVPALPGQTDVPLPNPQNQNGNVPGLSQTPTFNTNPFQTGGQPWDRVPDVHPGEINIPSFPRQWNSDTGKYPQSQQWNYFSPNGLKSLGYKEPVFKPEEYTPWPKVPQDIRIPDLNPWLPYKNKMKLQQWGLKDSDFLPSDKGGSIKRPEFKPDGKSTVPDFKQLSFNLPKLHDALKLQQWGDKYPEFLPKDINIKVPELNPDGGAPVLLPGQTDVPLPNPQNQNGNVPGLSQTPTFNTNPFQTGGQPWDRVPDIHPGEINIPSFPRQWNTDTGKYPQSQQWNYFSPNGLKSLGYKQPVFKPEENPLWPKVPQDIRIPDLNPWLPYKNKMKLQQWGLKDSDFLPRDTKTPSPFFPSDVDFKAGSVKRPEFKPEGRGTAPDFKQFSFNLPKLHDALKLQQWGDKYPEFLPKEIKVPTKSHPWKTPVREFLPSRGKAKAVKNQENEKVEKLTEEELLDILSRALDD